MRLRLRSLMLITLSLLGAAVAWRCGQQKKSTKTEAQASPFAEWDGATDWPPSFWELVDE